jgi:glycogen(starch) synthase
MSTLYVDKKSPMKILMSSHAFYPSIGGQEAVSEMLARGFMREGHEVTVITQTPAGGQKTFPFRVIRQPRPAELLQLVKESYVYLHIGISLRAAWPLLFVHKPWVVAHQTWIPVNGGMRGLKGRVKRLVLRRARCISISRAVAEHLETPSVVIPNLYDDEVFREYPGVMREENLIFLGRLIRDKGVDLLLDALVLSREKGLQPGLTVVGGGPEEEALKALMKKKGIDGQVNFVGVKRGPELAALLNRHRILVVPSRWNEPFGIVALEGMACGCVVVGSEGGGLKEAIGPGGVTFPNGNVASLVRCLTDLLTHPEELALYRQKAREHLSRHSPRAVAGAYLEVLESAYHEYRYGRLH